MTPEDRLKQIRAQLIDNSGQTSYERKLLANAVKVLIEVVQELSVTPMVFFAPWEDFSITELRQICEWLEVDPGLTRAHAKEAIKEKLDKL